MPSDPFPLGILLISGTHERAHYGFVLATGAASIGRPTIVFATNEGCRALLADWSSLEQAGRDAAVRLRGVAGLGELRDAARELGVRLLACDAGLKLSAIRPESLLEGVEVAGVTTFLASVGAGQIVTL